MSDTIREKIMQNRLTALQTLLYTDVFTTRPFMVVDRAKASMFEPTQYPALFIYPGKETKTQKNLVSDCVLPLVLELSVQLANTNADAALNALMQQVAVVMNADRSCGGYAESCYEADNDFAVGLSATSGQPDRAIILMTWLIKYKHHAKDPTINL